MPKLSFRRIDPVETLGWRLNELKGFSARVPPLIEADRQRRYDNLKATTRDASDDDLLALYEIEAGREEGEGHADFGRTCLSASIVFAWDVFFAYLVREIVEFRAPGASGEEMRQRQRQVQDITQLKVEWSEVGLDLAQLPRWQELQETRLLRNALVHNGGRYTTGYLKSPLARRRSDIERDFGRRLEDRDLLDYYEIPLDEGYVRQRLEAMLDVFREAYRFLKRFSQ